MPGTRCDDTAGRSGSRGCAPGCAAVAIAALLALAALIGWDDQRLVTSHYEVEVNGLTGVRIAQISDLHDAAMDERLLAQVRAADPDLIAITGDYVSVDTPDLTHALQLAAEIDAIAPTYAVLGNHEADSPLRAELLVGFDRAGVEVLRNETTAVSLGGRRVTLAGIDDPRVWRDRGVEAADVSRLVSSLDAPEDQPMVLLAHRPEELREYSAADADLVLSGHAHGGQVRIPGVGGLWAPHQGLFPRLTSGVHTDRGTVMVISRGLGDSGAPIRINNPPELVIIDAD